MIILGVDPGTATTGWGVIKKDKQGLSLIDFGTIQTKPSQGKGQRLQQIHQKLSKITDKFGPQVVAVEKLFFFKNLKTALPVSEARGVILLLAAQKNKLLVELTPLQVKMGICGYGRADKKQVQKMVKEILKLDNIPKPDDAADALAIALCCSFLNFSTKKGLTERMAWL